MEEIWKDIPGYEGLYQVSNLGRVKSLPKEWITGKGGKGSHNGKILSKCLNKEGYELVRLYLNSKGKSISVHQLVAMAFLGHEPCAYKFVIDHIDDNKSNNRLDNLQVVTNRYNTRKTQGKYSSKYKGVCWNKRASKWQSAIRINGKKKHLGLFDCELEAHHAYQKALKDLVN
jgi:hypothetical protein